VWTFCTERHGDDFFEIHLSKCESCSPSCRSKTLLLIQSEIIFEDCGSKNDLSLSAEEQEDLDGMIEEIEGQVHKKVYDSPFLKARENQAWHQAVISQYRAANAAFPLSLLPNAQLVNLSDTIVGNPPLEGIADWIQRWYEALLLDGKRHQMAAASSVRNFHWTFTVLGSTKSVGNFTTINN